MHFTDCHAQLMPAYFREPNVNIGVGVMAGRSPHLVGAALLEQYRITPNSRLAHAFTHLDYVDAARTFGKIGGFAHLATLVKKVRAALATVHIMLTVWCRSLPQRASQSDGAWLNGTSAL